MSKLYKVLTLLLRAIPLHTPTNMTPKIEISLINATFSKINCANWEFGSMVWARTSMLALKITVWAVNLSMNPHIFPCAE